MDHRGDPICPGQSNQHPFVAASDAVLHENQAPELFLLSELNGCKLCVHLDRMVQVVNSLYDTIYYVTKFYKGSAILLLAQAAK